MYAAIFAALSSVVKWLFGGATLKFLFASMLVFGFTVLIDVFLSLLPAWFSGDSLTNSMTGALSPAAWYFIDVFNLQYGLSIVVSASIVSFLIRRIPFIG